MDVTEVRAAGGLITRRLPTSESEVLVVHRPRYDDWSFPKGKLDAGETFEEAAVREVREETGLLCRVEREVGDVRYRDALGRPKLVRYWLMHPLEGDVSSFESTAEIDNVRWVTVREAARLLSYRHDRELLRHVDG